MTTLFLDDNQLTSLILPAGLTNLTSLYLYNNQLSDFSFPNGLTRLATLNLYNNQLRSLTLPPELLSLNTLVLDANPLQSVILPKALADGALANTVTSMRNRGVIVSTYSLTVSLAARPQNINGTFECVLNGPPGTYRIQVTPDFSAWTDIGPVINTYGSVPVTDTSASSRAQSFYRAVR